MDEMLKALLALGPGGLVAGLMFFLWKEERAERREHAAAIRQIAKEAIEAENDMTTALNTLSAKIKVAP